jgi:tetratricopeptide (TPR) repeat protein
MASVFISYRRDDAPTHAGRLYDRLEHQFGRESVFIDLETEHGANYLTAIERALDDSYVLIAVMGPRWLDRDRLQEPESVVRFEIATALRRDDVTVIPVLVQGADMPRAADLPDDLHALTLQEAVQLAEPRWRMQVDALVETLQLTQPSMRADKAVQLLGQAADLRRDGYPEEARELYQAVINSREPTWTPAANAGLGDILRQRGDVAGARTHDERAIEAAGDPYAASRLGTLLSEAGDVAGASEAFQIAIDSGHDTWAKPARKLQKKLPR